MRDIAKQHQRKVAYKTLQMSDAAVFILGGMTKEEARIVLAKDCVKTFNRLYPNNKVSFRNHKEG